MELTDLTDFAERFELAHRACQFVGSLIQFFKQPHVLDGDDGLVGEGLEQVLSACRKKAGPRVATDVDRPDRRTLPQQRRCQNGPNTAALCALR